MRKLELMVSFSVYVKRLLLEESELSLRRTYYYVV